MTELHWLGIYFTLFIVFCGFILSWFLGTNGPLATKWKKEAHELEVKISLHTGPEVIEYWCRLAKLYIRLGRRWDGEKAFRSAIQIAEQQFGMANPTLVSPLEEYARFLAAASRGTEANTIRRRVKEIKEKIR